MNPQMMALAKTVVLTVLQDERVQQQIKDVAVRARKAAREWASRPGTATA